MLFGIDPDDQILPKHQGRQTRRWIPAEKSPAGEEPKLHTMDIDFQALMERDREDPELSAMHSYFSKVKPTAENGWTGRFQGKNLVWIVAEGFSDRMLDPYAPPHSGSWPMRASSATTFTLRCGGCPPPTGSM